MKPTKNQYYYIHSITMRKCICSNIKRNTQNSKLYLQPVEEYRKGYAMRSYLWEM